MQHSSQLDFEKLFRTHNTELCNLAYNLVRDKDTAKDIVQEVFLKLWQNKMRINLGEQIKHYLFKATVHTALNQLRNTKKIIRLDDDLDLMNKAAATDRHEIGFKELEWRVRQAIDKLPPKCKAIYILCRQEGLKYQEVADTLELSLKTVENQMGIALEKLRNDLKPYLTKEFLVVAIFALTMLSILLS